MTERPLSTDIYFLNNAVYSNGQPDNRARCGFDDKVVFENQKLAKRSAANATVSGKLMREYQGKCGHWHVSRNNLKVG